jgi:hypothetical protein
MLSRRIVLGLLMLALLANLAGGAQCVVRCAHPVTPPPCHHHSPQKEKAPSQACAADMAPAESRAAAAVSPMPAIARAVVVFAALVFGERPLLLPPVAPREHTVLRI